MWMDPAFVARPASQPSGGRKWATGRAGGQAGGQAGGRAGGAGRPGKSGNARVHGTGEGSRPEAVQRSQPAPLRLAPGGCPEAGCARSRDCRGEGGALAGEELTRQPARARTAPLRAARLRGTASRHLCMSRLVALLYAPYIRLYAAHICNVPAWVRAAGLKARGRGSCRGRVWREVGRGET